MAFEMEIQTPVAPDEALRLIKSRAAYSQESLVPPDLRKGGVFGVQAEVAGHAFRLDLQELNRRPPFSLAVLTGTLRPRVEGGTDIRARIGVPRSAWPWYAVLGAITANALWTASWPTAAAFAVAMVILAIRDEVHDTGITRQDAGAAHLADQLEGAFRLPRDVTAARAI